MKNIHTAKIFDNEDNIIDKKDFVNPYCAIKWAKEQWHTNPNAFYWKITKTRS